MYVQIDQTRHDELSSRVDDLVNSGRVDRLLDRRDPVTRHGDIANLAKSLRRVDDFTAADDNVITHEVAPVENQCGAGLWEKRGRANSHLVIGH